MNTEVVGEKNPGSVSPPFMAFFPWKLSQRSEWIKSQSLVGVVAFFTGIKQSFAASDVQEFLSHRSQQVSTFLPWVPQMSPVNLGTDVR